MDNSWRGLAVILGPALKLGIYTQPAPKGAIKGVGGWGRRHVPRVEVVLVALSLGGGVEARDLRDEDAGAPLCVDSAIKAHTLEDELQLGASGDGG